jgi:hypothetical protein
MANGQFDYGQLLNLGMGIMKQRKMDQQQAIENQMAAQRLEMQKEYNKRLQEQFELNRSIQMDQLFSSMAQKGVSESDAFNANPNWTPEQRLAYSNTVNFYKGQKEAWDKFLEQNPHLARLAALQRATRGMEGGEQAYQSMAPYLAPQGGVNWEADLLAKYSVIRETKGRAEAENYVITIFGKNGKNLLDSLNANYEAKSIIADAFAQQNGAGQDPILRHHYRILGFSNTDKATTEATMKLAYDRHQEEIARKDAAFKSQLQKEEIAARTQGQKDVVDYRQDKKENSPSQQIRNINMLANIARMFPEVFGGTVNNEGIPFYNAEHPFMQGIKNTVNSFMPPSTTPTQQPYGPPQVKPKQAAEMDTSGLSDGELLLFGLGK